MAYSTITRVRQVAGFVNNTDILDALVTEYLNRGAGIVKSAVAGKYNISDLAGATFEGSPAQEFLRTAEDLISAGLLLIDQYGEMDPERTGYKKKQEGMNMLKDLKNGDQRLIDTNDADFPIKGSSPNLPNGPVLTGPSLDCSPRKFGVDQVF